MRRRFPGMPAGSTSAARLPPSRKKTYPLLGCGFCGWCRTSGKRIVSGCHRPAAESASFPGSSASAAAISRASRSPGLPRPAAQAPMASPGRPVARASAATPVPVPRIALVRISENSSSNAIALLATGGSYRTVERAGMERLIIVGSGPAGLTAAIYAARANLRPLVLAGGLYGGQLMLTTEVENYPGFPDGIMGPDLMMKFREQAERFGARIENVDVTSVSLTGSPLVVRTADDEYHAKTVIIATGASARWLGIPGEEKLRGRGVSTCATCDGAFFRDKHIVVVGGGDSAMEEALFLTRFGSKVTVIHRRDSLRASKIMAERAMSHVKISFIWDTAVEEVLGDEHTT